MKDKIKLHLDLPDVIVETYAKAFLAYRISLENWFLLNEILSTLRNEKISTEDLKEKLENLFSQINTELVEELVKLNIIAEKKEKSNAEG
ncbi:MAG: hypothetical protein ABGX24_00745 [Aquificota bacterium]|jgi:predicted HAD superfamily phosphohydrolase